MHRFLAIFSIAALVSACDPTASDSEPSAPGPAEPDVPAPAEPAPEPKGPAEPAELPARQMVNPVDFWENGKTERQVDAATAALHGHLILDLGEAWVPYIFTDGPAPVDPESGEAAEGEPRTLPNAYRETYLALARGEFPDDEHGERARDDKYLELFGIMPTLDLMRERFEKTAKLKCNDELDLQPLIDFHGLITYRSNNAARKKAGDFLYLRRQVQKYMKAQRVDDPEQVDPEKLDDREKDRLKRFKRQAEDWYAVDATQKRLKCEGFFKGRGRYVRGALDWPTHDALAEFERRHRIYSWGYLGRDTLRVLRMSPMEAEREGVLRVLTERAIHAAGVIEDGSIRPNRDGSPRTFKGADGKQHPIPNLVADLEKRIVEAFGLQTPESTLEWLRSLGELPDDGHRYVAIDGPELPEYYDGDMELTLEYDRGDVWYDFPYDEQGRERAQPVSRRPRVTIYTRYEGRKIPLARFGTTIGGWRSEQIGEAVMWRYKDSPVGPRVWKQIVASPVWLPPESTPPRDLLKRRAKRKPGEPKWEVSYHETGPSYASAYGLVAAYHRKYTERGDGTIDVGGDEGIRTHGSVDYMSIMRRHSHGCHRLHNHIAVRLMSFVLAHRPHIRRGQQPLAFKREFEYEDETYNLDLSQGGYVFELERPLRVEVLEGRIRGKVKEPIEFPVPKYDDDIGAYVLPDGGAVQVEHDDLVSVPLPLPDGGLPDPDAGSPELGAPPKPPAPSSRQQAGYDPKAPPDPSSEAPSFFGARPKN
ncbi:MAG: hypothetical protein PVI30_09710 [Myxococcales bacterium]|jgi:hypothetical protein